MVRLGEAREIQRRRQRKSVKRFAYPSAVILAACGGLYAAGLIQEYLLPAGLAAGVLVLLFALRAEVYKIFTKREFSGTVTRIDVETEVGAVVTTVSPQAVFYVTDKKGRTKSRSYPYIGTLVHVKEGDKIAFLRYLHNPVLVEEMGSDVPEFVAH